MVTESAILVSTSPACRVEVITLAWLRREGACHDQLTVFRRIFGRRAEITWRNLDRAIDAGLNIKWLANHLLTEDFRRAYNEVLAPARRAYDEAVASAFLAYNEAVAPARRAYDEAVASAFLAYDEAVAPASRAYYEAVASAFLAYNEVLAPARRAYDEVLAPARRAYNEAVADALVAVLGTEAISPLRVHQRN